LTFARGWWQAKYHKAEGSERSSQSENGDIKPPPGAMSSHKHHGRRVSAQHSASDEASNSSVRDHDSSDGDPRTNSHETKQQQRRKSAKHGTSKDLLRSGNDKLTAGKSRGRHRSFDVQRSRTVSGQG